MAGLLLSPIVGPKSRLDIVLSHDNGNGLRFHIGLPDARERTRTRQRLAPAVTTEDCAAPSWDHSWSSVGIVHRQLGDIIAYPLPSPSVIANLSRVPGKWFVHWRINGVPVQEIDRYSSALLGLADEAATQITTTSALRAAHSTTVVSSSWTRIESWLIALYEQAARGRTEGIWEVATWLGGESPDDQNGLLSALSAGLPALEHRAFATTVLSATGTTGPEPISLLNTSDMAILFTPPSAGIPGLEVKRSPPDSRRPSRSKRPLDLGRYWSQPDIAAIGLEDLEGHAFVTGTTGAGKTTTLHRLLSELWNRYRIPFLVIDPVKDEYSEVASLFNGGISVVNGAELKTNLLTPWPKADARQHIERVAQAFRGAFSMPSPTPYVVAQLFDTVSSNPANIGSIELHDLRDALGPLVEGLGYGSEISSNILASISTRLNLLLSPVRAHRFAWPDSVMVEKLFDGPTVVTLGDIVDEEERAFLVLLISLAVWDRARVTSQANPGAGPVQHVLVLEEAHRVMPEIQANDPSSESGSAAQLSAELLSNMLAEVRSYGQQVIVVDQSPAKVSSNVLRNTNLKLAHRIVHPADQEQVAAAMGLSEEQTPVLGVLERGQVLVSSRSEPAPQTFRVIPATDTGRGAGVTSIPTNSAPWRCCRNPATARNAEGHFEAWRAAGRAEGAMALFLIGLRIGEGDGKKLRTAIAETLARSRPEPSINLNCLAWSGLRRVTVAERGAGLHGSKTSFQRTHQRAFDAWMDAGEVDRHAVILPGLVGSGSCPSCGKKCVSRVAGRLYAASSTNGSLPVLARRGSDDQIRAFMKAQASTLMPLLGKSATEHVERCQLLDLGLGRLT